TWETGWIFFRYTDTFHYYWFTISNEGIELGKKDCDKCKDPVDGQQFLVTKLDPKLDLNSWSHWKIIIIGNNIQVFVDGKLVIDYNDEEMSHALSHGNIAMYSEDAYVQYDNMDLESQ
ncbi:MAG TPA: family 16 glycoside hydrolase, partial [Candidatus Sulfopaludibacter sp.]|nr:family 16 glycoside hydrolase [Candidatus Sulfopaludibacter sp.]